MYQAYCDDYLIFDNQIDNLKIFAPKLSLELNKTGSFTFTIYPNHQYYNALQKMKSIITVYQDDYLIFRGRILNEELGFYNEKQVTCEGELAFLVDSIQRPYDFQSGDNHTTISDFFTYLITEHNLQVDNSHKFIVGDITVTDSNNYIVRSDSNYTTTLEAIQKKLIDSFGGYLWIRHEADGNYIDYLSDFDTISPQSIDFGKNLIDITKKVKGEDVATALIPLGAKDEDGRITIESLPDEETDDVCKSGDYVYSKTAVAAYGWIFKVKTWDDVTESTNLLVKAKAELGQQINILTSIELTAVDLAAANVNITAFHLGTYIQVRSIPHGLDTNLLVKKLSINLSQPASNKLALGTTYAAFTQQTTNAAAKYSDVAEKADETENQIVNLQTDIDQQIDSVVTELPNQILQTVSENYYLRNEANTLIESIETQFSQTQSEFEFQFNKFSQDLNNAQAGNDAQFKEINKYIRFVNGNIILGEESNPLILKIENDRISFLQNNAEVAYFSDQKLYVTDGEYTNSLRLGAFEFIPRQNGNLSFKKVVT